MVGLPFLSLSDSLKMIRAPLHYIIHSFITSQTKLHDTVCKRRRVATIATHDLSSISPPISYQCAPASEISLKPLGWTTEVKVQKFLEHVHANKPDRGGGKKAKAVDTAAAVLNK